ncbi:MAG: hypothetical protein Q7T01_04545 [bacterium]|nr:hypothetical protein [bacterium]
MTRIRGAMVGLPPVVVTYNLRTDFQSNEIAAQLRRMTLKEVRALRSGDWVYIDTDPLHPAGKVYGCRRFQVRQVEPAGSGFGKGAMRVQHSHGSTVVEPKGHNTLRAAKDPQMLAVLCAADWRATVVSLGDEPWRPRS